MQLPSCRTLTPPGRAAIAVLQLDAAVEHAAQAFDRNFRTTITDQVAQVPVGRILHGFWNGEELVVVRTGTTRWEIQCHGGRAATQAIIDSIRETLPALQALSESAVGSHAFTWQPQLEAELYQSLIHTRTRRTASWVLSQTNGLLRQELTTLVNLKDGSSEFNRRWNALRQARSFARHLTIPWRVLVMGRPNVGKSSLVNAIVGFDRAIVFDQAGTTRDVIEASTIVDGLPASFFDTAGLREHTDDQIEYAGMLGTRRVMAACDLALVIVDATDEASYDHSLLSGLPDQTPRAVVLNKCDLLSESALQQHVQRCRGMFNNTPILTVSATTGTGVDELLNWVMCSLVPDVPKLGVPLPVGDTLQALTAIDVPEDVTAEQREQIAKRLCQLLAPPASDS